jgi:hypothetical protein
LNSSRRKDVGVPLMKIELKDDDDDISDFDKSIDSAKSDKKVPKKNEIKED